MRGGYWILSISEGGVILSYISDAFLPPAYMHDSQLFVRRINAYGGLMCQASAGICPQTAAAMAAQRFNRWVPRDQKSVYN